MECGKAQDIVVDRPLANFPDDIWGDRFDYFSPDEAMMMEKYAKETEPLKAKVRTMLMSPSHNLVKKMRFIDEIERLGVSYSFEDEIKELLDQSFKELSSRDDFSGNDYGLFTTSTHFRIFRQHGYKMTCDVFEKFSDGKGKMKESLRGDLKGMLSLFEAANLRTHEDLILDEALGFSTEFLRSIPESSEEVRHAIKQVLHFGIQRVESRHFISAYENDESHDVTLLRLAKLDFNCLQLLHRKELAQVQKWWNGLGLSTRLPYARQRSVECHFWSIAMYYEPQYSFARVLLVKVLLVISILDDTYDAYGTFDELHLLTNAFEKWELSETEHFPEEYMKVVYEFVVNTYDEISMEMTRRGKPYAAKFAKRCVMDLIRSYYIEAKWCHEKYVPTFKEYMVNARITGVGQIITTSSLMGMEEIDDVRPYELVLQAPKPIQACELFGRLRDDIVSHQEEQQRGHVASAVECYMKEHGKSREEVVKIFNKMFEDAWKDICQAFLLVEDENHQQLPKPVLKRVLNLSRVVDAFYKVMDGYTYSAKLVKDDILATYAQPISLHV